ncbi:hypothetical protein O0I10_010914 [Lichtheimia ornata]|uniref:Endothelin-converting enzyme 1 n=1 Tax=Lichtheimia ornata TaxID=688661 RepID=A0AAD7UTW2_9FUNG|nr:uncharacterized protein O0I10_010914 [Lichtheimia ornata]KAJ8653478.1 hypothetical protein O0I10_010914 [Lichtheimia ornata]
MSDDNLEIIRKVLEGTYDELLQTNKADDFVTDETRAADQAIFDKVQRYYHTCMDEDTINDLGPTPLYPRMAQLLNTIKSWDIDSTEDEDIFDAKEHAKGLTDMIFEATMQASQPLIAIGVSADNQNPEKQTILVTQPSLILQSKQQYENEKAMELYRSGVNVLLTSVLGNDTWAKQMQEAGIEVREKEEIEDMVKRVVDFEVKLANITLLNEELQDPYKTYNPMKLSELQSKYPIIDWKSVLQRMIPEDMKEIPEPLIVMVPSYLQDLTQWFSSGEVSLKTIRDYFLLNEIYAWVYALDTHTRQLVENFVGRITSGTVKLLPRWNTCVSNTMGSFGEIVGRYYVMANFGGDDARAKVDELVTLIHESWLNRLADVDWLDKETRERAIKKVNQIKQKVAYSTVVPDDRSPQSLKDYYEDAHVTDSFIDSESSILQYQLKQAWDKLGKPTDKNEWSMTPPEVNAYYALLYNEIVVPAGILSSIAYGNDAPAYMNYGAIGMIVGHEFTHAFDNQGRKYDADGRLKQWWTNATSQQFEEKTQCFIRQYSNFTITGPDGKEVHVNGKLTLGENLADNGGVAAAYTAFKQAWDQGPLANGTKAEHVKLPGIDLTPEQLFYVSMGRLWCIKSRPEKAISRIFSDPHSPANVRVNGVMQNSNTFAEAFNCPAGSPMNPETKCTIW